MFSLRVDGGDADLAPRRYHPASTYDRNSFAIIASHIARHGDVGALLYSDRAAYACSDRHATAGYRNADTGSCPT